MSTARLHWPVGRRINDLLISIGVRLVAGIAAGGVSALAGWFIAWFFFLRPSAGLDEALVVFMTTVGVFGGIGASLAWLKPDSGVRVNLSTVLLAVIGGIGGALAGLLFARAVFDVDVTKSEGDITAIAAGGIAANLLPLIMFIVIGLRKSPENSRTPNSLPNQP